MLQRQTTARRNQNGVSTWAIILLVLTAGLVSLYVWVTFYAGRTGLVEFESSNDPHALKILFLGNSFTFCNDTPAILAGFIKSQDPKKALKIHAFLAPGYTLEQHLNNPDALAELKSGPWDYVILQENSGYPLSSRDKMDKAAMALDALVKQAGGKTVLLMTWGDKGHLDDQSIISQQYRKLAHQLNAKLVPAGDVWFYVLRHEPDLSFYAPDNHHPSALGSYLVGCALYATIMNKPPNHLPADIDEHGYWILTKKALSIPQSQADLLQSYECKWLDSESKKAIHTNQFSDVSKPIGRQLAESGHLEEAEQICREDLGLLLHWFPKKDDPLVARAYENLATVQYDKGKNAFAQVNNDISNSYENYQNAVKILQSIPDSDAEEVRNLNQFINQMKNYYHL